MISGFCGQREEFERYIIERGLAEPGQPCGFAAAAIYIIDYKKAAARAFGNNIEQMINDISDVISSCGKKDEFIVFPRNTYSGEFAVVFFGRSEGEPR